MKFIPAFFHSALFGALNLSAFSSTAPAMVDADRTALLQGVSEIGAPGVPGGVCAFGPQAFAVIAGKDGKKSLLPVVAATRWEKGRIVAFGHNGYLGTTDSSSVTFLTNSARWAAGDKPKPKIAIIKSAGLVTQLQSAGIAAEPIDGKDWSAGLTRFDVVCVDAHKLSAEDVGPLSKFVREGGGLVTAATGWGWLTGKERIQLATEFAGNQVLVPAGLAFTAGTPDKTTKTGYTAVGGDLTLLSASAALDAVIAQAGGKATLSPEQLTQAGTTLADTLRSLPADDKVFRPRLAALNTAASVSDFPRPDKALPADNALARLMVTQQLELLQQTKPEQLRAHPAADAFPGAVPKTAPRIPNRAITIDTSVPAWHSTGLYAAPGELIRVTVPPEIAGTGFALRIGCHTDSLWHLDQWQRAPEISRREQIKMPVATAANPFGGLIYIEVPEKSTPGKVVVTITGAVEAPRFILGQTSLTDWKTKLRNAPAPWAELETKKIILSVPSEKIRQLDDPEALMKFWDEVQDANADLIGISRDRKRPERIVPDTQISAGYMHSGYPIMTPLDKSVDDSLSLAAMKAGSWGHFHELGHNHQQPDWTFDGTSEVTCNLFSLYVMETLCGKPPGQGHDAMKPEVVDKRLRGYLGMSDKFSRWKSDPFLALTMYHQLRAAFGWETYKKVFAEYRDLPQEQRPKNDDDERDQWLMRFSRATGKNLGPFFEAWGVPTSTSARDSVKDLAAWMPANWPKL